MTLECFDSNIGDEIEEDFRMFDQQIRVIFNIHSFNFPIKKQNLYFSLKPYWDKSRNNLKIDENERVHSNTL